MSEPPIPGMKPGRRSGSASALYDPALPLPAAVDIERALLSCMMQAPDQLIPYLTSLAPEDFAIEMHSLLCELIQGQHREGKLVEPAVLLQVAYDRGLMEKFGPNGSGISDCCLTSNPANAMQYLKIVKEKSTQRKLVKVGFDLSTAIFDTPEEYRDAGAAAVERIISALTETQKKAGIVHFREATGPAADAIELAAQERGHVPEGLVTGFTDLDRVLWGLQPGENCFICGRPSMGKSSLAMNILTNMALARGHYQEFYESKEDFEAGTNPRQQKTKALLICLESSQKKAAIRAISSVSGVSMKKIRGGFASKADWKALATAKSMLDDGELYVWDAPGIFVEDLEMELKAFKARHPDLAIVCVDHCGKLRARGINAKAQPYEKVSYVSDRLMTLWLQLKVVGLPVWQLGRDTEKRANKKPQLSDLRDSGNLEQDASIVLSVYRPNVYDDKEPEDEALIGVLKNRDGVTNHEGIPVNWDANLTTFSSKTDKLFSNDEDKRQQDF